MPGQRPPSLDQWTEKELLPVPYAHAVFTVPPLLAQLALQNKKLIYTMLLRLSAETLMEVARNPKFLGAEIGFFSVLHSWTQQLKHHPHVHCVVPAGGLSFDHTSAGCLRIRAIGSFCRNMHCGRFFEERSRTPSRKLLLKGKSAFTEN